MTWSIIARDESGAFGVAVATRFFAVGALCPHAESSVGALCTQALVNPYYGRHGLDLLRAGISAPDVVKMLTSPDETSCPAPVRLDNGSFRLFCVVRDDDTIIIILPVTTWGIRSAWSADDINWRWESSIR